MLLAGYIAFASTCSKPRGGRAFPKPEFGNQPVAMNWVHAEIDERTQRPRGDKPVASFVERLDR